MNNKSSKPQQLSDQKSDEMITEESLEEGNSNPNKEERPALGFIGITEKHRLAMARMEAAWKEILCSLNMAYDLDITDENFRETPNRIAKMMILERCSGINSQKICIDLLGKCFPAMEKTQANDQLIVTTNPAIVYGICPHHFENVRYNVWTGYIPDRTFPGISKFSRAVELYAKQPILQESYTTGIVDIIMEGAKPKGAIVVVKGWHDCMVARGAKSNPNQCMVTSAVRGLFAQPGMETYKEEFFTLCRATGL